jgi:hypothetical protein
MIFTPLVVFRFFHLQENLFYKYHKERSKMSNKYTIENITAGESWACKFKVKTFLTEDGKIFDTRSLSVGEPVKGASPGEYTSIGVITKRDPERRLVELQDIEQDYRTWIVSWDDCWDIDVVEWTTDV